MTSYEPAVYLVSSLTEVRSFGCGPAIPGHKARVLDEVDHKLGEHHFVVGHSPRYGGSPNHYFARLIVYRLFLRSATFKGALCQFIELDQLLFGLLVMVTHRCRFPLFFRPKDTLRCCTLSQSAPRASMRGRYP